MRHFAGILLGVLFVPIFFALNWAVNYTSNAAGDTDGGWSLAMLLGAYGVVGVVAGLLLASRSISPLALLLCGLIIAVAEVMLLLPRLAGAEVNVPRLYDYPSVTDGYLLVTVAAALVFAVFFPSRWRRAKTKEDEYDEYAMDDRDMVAGQRDTDPRYDASWGTGRNEYAEEPEVPYEPATRQMPVTQPGQYDQPPVGQYDQQALGYQQPDPNDPRYQDQQGR